MLSQSQREWMWKNKPEMAKEWEAHTPKGIKLPEHVSRRKNAIKRRLQKS